MRDKMLEEPMPSGRQRIIDTDVHTTHPSRNKYAARLDEDTLSELNQYYTVGTGVYNPYGGMRGDTAPPAGGPPGSDPSFTVEQHLDPFEIDYALLNPSLPSGSPDPDLTADLARGTNDWTIEAWLGADERYLGGIVVGADDPEQASREIRRVGRNPRMVHVYLNASPRLLGDPFLDPIYDACNELRLPLTLHVGGQEAGVNSGSWPIGRPSTYLEYKAGVGVAALYHVQHLVLEGVFVRFPDLRVVISEHGVSWLPFVMWRLDMTWRESRPDVPWLVQPPSDYIREHVRLTTQPFEESPDANDIIRLLAMVGAQDLIMFSSDYPHYDFDRPDETLRRFPAEWREQVAFGNAWEFYRLRERLGRDAHAETLTAVQPL